jgi:hypothetical protein
VVDPPCAPEPIDRIRDEALDVFGRLTTRDKRLMLEYLEDRPREFLMSKNDIVRAWLNSNGIYGFEEGLSDLIEAINMPRETPKGKLKLVVRDVSYVRHTAVFDIVRADGKIVRSGLTKKVAELERFLLEEYLKNNWTRERYFEERAYVFSKLGVANVRQHG